MPRLLADTNPLRVSPDVRRLWWRQGLASFGSQLSVVAVGLQVYALTGSTLSVDNHDRRTVAPWASTGLWIVSIALQAWLHVGSVGRLYALVAVQSAAFAINNSARQAIAPRLLPPAPMPTANSLQTIAWDLSFTVGPARRPGPAPAGRSRPPRAVR